MSDAVSIPFNRPVLAGRELEYIQDVIRRGHSAGDGAYTRLCQELLERELGVPRVLLTTSCTHALEMAALLLDVGPGDEVLMPSFTFVSTANAFALRGALPVFVDVRPDTLNLDESRLEALVTPRTKAVVPVHYAGIGCAMEPILDVARRHGLAVVEDNAHGLFGRYRERWLGTFGALASLSFHETKNFTCGEGGALLINDPGLQDRAEILREKGTDRSRFFRGQVDKYTWVDLGSSYVPSDLLAAFLYAQLEERERIQARRRRIWERYLEGLAPWAAERGVRVPEVPEGCEPAYHLFHLLMPSLAARTELIGHLRRNGVLAVFHYVPLHLSQMGQRLGGRPGDCPVTEDVSDRLVRLPFFNDLTDEEQDRVIRLVETMP
ncbi:MAG TPA: dTDP-4-amino-4,6-dideoxygalactose transaminase [Thermoanaerobaculia bacterium]|jgi:dTDP-4-amino-4,6-dideoxygalactose transaminase|nr:dTDP-4-amino-4,6-dideoxygalactose transaminase [Thermoanaerobaculia bacterium]